MDEAERIAKELNDMYKRLGVPPMKNEKNQRHIDKRQAELLMQAVNDPNMSVDDLLKSAGLI